MIRSLYIPVGHTRSQHRFEEDRHSLAPKAPWRPVTGSVQFAIVLPKRLVRAPFGMETRLAESGKPDPRALDTRVSLFIPRGSRSVRFLRHRQGFPVGRVILLSILVEHEIDRL